VAFYGHVDVGDGLALVHGASDGGLAAGVVVEHLCQCPAVLLFGRAVQLQHVQTGLVDEEGAFFAVYDEHGNDHAVKHPLRESEAVLQVFDHSSHGVGECAKFVPERSLKARVEIPPRDGVGVFAKQGRGARDHAATH